MEFTVYILKGATGTHYTGQTKDFAKRLKQHEAGYCHSTKRMRPLSVLYTTTFPTRRKARALEVHIKKRGAARYLKAMQLKDQFSHLCIIS